MKNFLKLIVSILLCQTAGIVGSFFTAGSVDTWYEGIKKPFFTPPDAVFAPVWIVLYLLMGVSMFLVWLRSSGERHVRPALAVFMVQLVLNAIWSGAFFGLRSPLAGLIVIILLWIVIVLTIQAFKKISRIAALLLIPYILWVSYALVLNAAIFFLNC
jgi:tryptophan-rich sensory protein